MKLDLTFEESCSVLPVNFGEVTDFNADMFKEGYNSGYGDGAKDKEASMQAENAKVLADCNNALEAKGAAPAETLPEVPEKIDSIKAAGVDVSVPAVIYRCEDLNLFGAKEVTFNFDRIRHLASFYHITGAEYYVENTTVEHITINCAQQITSCNMLLYINVKGGDHTLKRLTLNADTSKATFSNVSSFFYALEVIDGTPLDLTSAGAVNRFLYRMDNLREIRFVAGSIHGNIGFNDTAVLSADSVQSIVDGLADMSGSTAKTLTLHTSVVLRLTDEQYEQIEAKNWSVM